MVKTSTLFRWMAVTLTALLLGACGVIAPPPQEPLDLTIAHTGKVYGEIYACG
jgi:hypothetical protein